MRAVSVRVDRAPSWPQFAAWLLCGAAATFVFVAAFTIGPLGFLGVPVFAGLALLLGGANVSAVGVVAGPAVWAFVLAWLNRAGPGSVCHATASSVSCQDESSPWPFLVVGAVLLVVPTTLFAVKRRRSVG
ncbi:MAG TPA: hypothetical protein VFU35_00280 [Jatrophihabitans sp.]|nr:hypothetical protein [Jatrophihabitans sp.]